MKKNIHPQYYQKTKTTCACGSTFIIGSTKPEIQTEICGNCHPFYTEKEKLLDTAGRVEKFKTRISMKKKLPKKKSANRQSKQQNLTIKKIKPIKKKKNE